ncbi:unnamed protein product [Arctia plantaginis]|uniref:RNA-directed DNA polymerase n=1 Tax=Arctia plantaginis TaxID=874455 RepID=A0A8S1B6K3_ARCPL|nr:unnamed protein product [Arctia plantaginis]
MNVEVNDWLHTVQMTDPELKRIKLILESDENNVKDIVTNFVVKNVKIYRRVGDQLKWVVPKGARWRVCQLNHDESGHFAYDKTLDKIKHDYWFPKMNKFIRKYVSSCLNCAYSAKHVLNTVATPRANGQIERYNRTILESLTATNHGMDERMWDENVGQVQWGLNNTKNKSTGRTPAEVGFGFRTISSNEGPIINSLNETRPKCNQSIKSPRHEVRAEVQESIKRSQDYMKKYFDNTRNPTKFYKIGDLVMIPNHHTPADGKSKKLRPKFRGPFRVTGVLDNDRYEISSIDELSKRKYKKYLSI